jgi:hypothetical protein
MALFTLFTQEDHEKAFQHYYKATHLNRDFVLPFYGLGQLYIHQRKWDKVR